MLYISVKLCELLVERALYVCFFSFLNPDPAGNWTTQRPTDDRKRRKLQWYGHVSRSSGLAKTILQGTVKGGKKTRQAEEEVGRQHQGMDRPGVRQVSEGSDREKWRKL